MPNYENSKIYKIVDVGYNLCYIGSTVESLAKRMAKHRHDYKRYKAGLKGKYKSFELFDTFGVEHCKIELIEKYPCESREELDKREGYYQQNTDCINKSIAGRKMEQWREDNKEHILKYARDYREKNADSINQKKYVKYHCDCGTICCAQRKTSHFKTQKHLNYLKSLEQD